MAQPVADYAIVGDGETAAVIGRNGSVDFLCWPRFDSDSCFNAILGDERHGHWRIAPEGAHNVERRYRGDTLILETVFRTESGAVRLTDFMPMRDGPSYLVRTVEGLEGHVAMRLDLVMRFDYGSIPPWTRPHGDGLIAEIGPNRVVLHSPIALERDDASARARFGIAAGDSLAFSLGYALSSEAVPPPIDSALKLRETQAYWEGWIGRFDLRPEFGEAVRRSLLTLRALIHRPTGGLVAAVTTSLPEVIGGSLNWDYRYTWLRDATFTLSALLHAGFKEEARDWNRWILRAIGGTPEKIHIMYRVDGMRHLHEWNADWLPGHGGAQPVRIGNEAANQRQLDIFGELINALHFTRQAGIDTDPRSFEVEAALIAYLETIWREPGADIWESRGEPQHYTYSKVMAWVGIDRFLNGRTTQDIGSAGDHARLVALRDEMHAEICRDGFNRTRNSFTRIYGGAELDASLLLLPIVGFLPIDDPRIAGTIAAIEAELTEDGLVRRQARRPGKPNEATFIACSCWLAICQSMQGRKEAAKALLGKVVSLANDVGLLSEEYDVPHRCLTGNMPQALSHIGIINAALEISGLIDRDRSGFA